MSAAVRAARQAKQWALAVGREADRVLHEARQRAETLERRHRVTQRLLKTGRVLRTAGRAALVAAVATGIVAARAEQRGRDLPKRRRPRA
jgi:hypothetical protein